MTGLIIMILILLGIFIALLALAGRRYAEFMLRYGQAIKVKFTLPAFLYVIDRLRFMERFTKITTRFSRNLSLIYGNRDVFALTKLFLAETLSLVWLTLILSTLLTVASKEINILYIGILLAFLIPYLKDQELSKKVQKNSREIIMELPEFLSRVTLLVNAGETVQKALIRCVEQKSHMTEHPLYAQLIVVVTQISNNFSFQAAMEEFSKKCGVQEVSVFVNTVLMNYRRGGDEFVLSLRQLSQDLWEKRKALAKTLGEEASSKLVFPMVLIFVIVLIVVASPAVMMMK